MAACPNINDPVWKQIVEEHGEMVAVDAFIENNYEIPASLDLVQHQDATLWTDEKTSKVEQFQSIINAKRKIHNALAAKLNAYDGSDNEVFVKDLRKLIKDFSDADHRVGAILFMRNAEKMLDSLEPKLERVKDNLELSKQASDFASTYSLIGELTKVAAGIDNSKALNDRISSIKGRVDKFKTKYHKYARNTIVNRMGAESTIMRHKARTKLGRKYEEDNLRRNSNLSSKEYEKAKKEYVEKALVEKRDEILRQEKAHIKELLTLAPRDISGITASLVDPRGVNDHVIQLAVKLLDRADFNAKEDFNSDRIQAIKVWEEFTKGKKGALITDQKKLYKGIYEERNGKTTGYYARELYSDFYKEKKAVLDKYNEDADIWNNENKDLTKKERAAADKPHYAVLKKWKEENLINPTEGLEDSNVQDKHRNFDFAKISSEQKAMYDYLVEFNQESDRMLTSRGKLGYKIPSITKTDSELISDQGLIKAGKTKWEDMTKIKVDDVDSGELEIENDIVKVLTDENGKSLKRIAIPFRGSLEQSDQSFDLMGLALSNRFVSRNYQEKGKVKLDLEVIKELMGERDLLIQKGGKQVVKSVRDMLGIGDKEAAEVADTKKGLASKSLELLDSVLEDRLYGKHNISGNEVLNKIVNTSIKWSANNMLIANYLGATANVLAGQTMNFFESTRGTWYDRKNLFNAELKYMRDIGSNVKDIKSVQHTSRTNLFLDKFLDTSMDWSGLSNNLTSDSKIKNLMSMSTLHGLNGSAEHFVQSTLMYATLDNLKVKNKQGEYVDKKGAVVDRADAATMDEIYKEVDGELVWSDDNLTVEGFDSMTREAEFAINRRIKDIAADLQGNYDSNNRAMIQRYWYGKLAFYLRKWIVRGVQNRWRGVETTDKAFDDLSESDKFYSEASQDYREGSYTSALRFVRQNIKAMKSFQGEVLKLEWNKLTDMEKGNIKKAAMEMTLLAASFAASAFLGKLALEEDDEDAKAALYVAAYLMRRQAGELATFAPVLGTKDVLNTLTTPTAVASTVELGVKTIGQVMEDLFRVSTGQGLEVKQSGKEKGDIKVVDLALDFLISGRKNYSSTAQDKLNWLNQ